MQVLSIVKLELLPNYNDNIGLFMFTFEAILYYLFPQAFGVCSLLTLQKHFVLNGCSIWCTLLEV